MNIEDYTYDQRCVMTLDAGGTNFVFSAMRGYEEIVSPVSQPACPDDLEACLRSIINGFEDIESQLDKKPDAISFAFPGPADYNNGIIGDLPNFPAFNGEIALGPMLENHFCVPVFINNDGGLFTLGEASCGFLPWVNAAFEHESFKKRYQNLIGVTIGTGFGGGLVLDGKLCKGDNSAGGEIWLVRNKVSPAMCAEEGASIRAVQRYYKEAAGLDSAPSPKEIYDIGLNKKAGDQEAAKEAYRLLGETVGDALANVVTMFDGLIVIGGGLAGAKELFLPALLNEMNSSFETPSGNNQRRLDVEVCSLKDDSSLKEFTNLRPKKIPVPMSDQVVTCSTDQKIGIGFSRLGTNRAVAVGAYQTALNALNNFN